MELLKYVEHLYLNYGYLIVFVSAFIEITPMGWTIPGGLFLAAGGYYAFDSGLSLPLILLCGWFGAWLVFLLAYLLGRRTGLFLVKKLKQEKNAQRAKILLQKHGVVILTTSLMANLTRFWVAYIAGHEKYNFVKFLFFSAAASLTWSSLMVTVGYLAGFEKGNLESQVAKLGILSWGLFVLALAVVYWKARREFGNFKGGSKNDNLGD